MMIRLTPHLRFVFRHRRKLWMIEDTAVKYWDCQNCLGMGHMSDTCTNRIRCRLCFRSGHVKKDCPGINAGSTVWVPKVPSPGFEPRALTEPLPDASGSLPSPPTSTTSPQNQSAQKPQSPPPSPAAADTPSMAVYELDPRRFLPAGHDIIDGGAERLPRTYYTPL